MSEEDIVRDLSIDYFKYLQQEVIRNNEKDNNRWFGGIIDYFADKENYDDLDISDYYDDLKVYHQKIIDKEDMGLEELKKILVAVYDLDSKSSTKLNNTRDKLLMHNRSLFNLYNVINTNPAESSIIPFTSEDTDFPKYINGLALGFYTDEEMKKRMFMVETMKNSYGFSMKDSLLFERVYKLCKEKYQEEDFNHHYFSHMSALCINYSGGAKRWKYTAGNPSTQEAIAYFKELGLSDSEVKELFLVINAQHGGESAENLSKYGITITKEQLEQKRSEVYLKGREDGQYKDFAHELVALSIFTNKSTSRYILDGIMSDQLELFSSMKGDAYSGRIGDADTYSDLDANNIYYRLKNGGDLFDTYINYNSQVSKGEINRGIEFLSWYGDGDIKKGREKFENDLREWNLGSEYLTGEYKDDIRNAIEINSMQWIPFAYEHNKRNMDRLKEMDKQQEDLRELIEKRMTKFLDDLDTITHNSKGELH